MGDLVKNMMYYVKKVTISAGSTSETKEEPFKRFAIHKNNFF